MSLNSGRTAQYKHGAHFLRHFGLHSDVNDAHRAGANRLKNKTNMKTNTLFEVLVQSLFQDRTASWVRIVNGVDKYVTESMLAKEDEDIASEKPIAKARPRQKPTVTLTPVSIPVRTDIETQRSNDQKCFDVSKAITRLLRHDQTVHRDID